MTTYTLNDVGPECRAGEQVALSDAERQAIADQWNANDVQSAALQALAASGATMDAAIGAATYGSVQPATLAQLKAMDNPTFGTWFDANFTTAAQAIGLLKLLTRVVLRRLL